MTLRNGLLLGIAICVLPLAVAHKYFFGLTEVSWNSRSNNLEVVHQYTLHDVQSALASEYGSDFRIDQPDAEQKLKRWVENNFHLINSKGNALTLNWVGFEADFQNIWFYQERSLTKPDFCGWQVQNALLMSAFSAQVNTVNFVQGEKTDGVTLSAQGSQKTLRCNSDAGNS